MDKFRGTGVALVTPFTEDDKIDVEGLKKLVDYNINNGVDYLVALGTTGETPTLSVTDKELVKSTVIKASEGRVPLILGMGGADTLTLTKEIGKTSFEGFDAILSVTPYYNKPTQEGLIRHYQSISEVSPLPVIMYNVPHRTGCNLLPETVLDIQRKCDNIIGIKEAGGDIDQAMLLLRLLPSDFLIISGDDSLALPEVLGGATGVISVIANGLPKHYSKMIHLAIDGHSREAYKIFHQLGDTINLIYREGNPAGVKVILREQIGTNISVRLPLIEASSALQRQIKDSLHKLK